MEKYSDALAGQFHALADSTRQGMIARLSRGPASVGALAGPTGLALPTVMKHLRVLEDAGLISTAKEGRVRTCTLNTEPLRLANGWLAQRIAEWEARLDRMDALALKLEEEEKND